MIIGFNCSQEVGNLRVLYIASYASYNNKKRFRISYVHLCITNEVPGNPFVDVSLFPRPINVAVPKFRREDAAKADAWLLAYATKINKWLNGKPLPLPTRQENGTGDKK